MSIENRSKQYGAVFGDWHIEQLLGTGSCGKSAVFSLYRDNNGWREYSALKVISLIEEVGPQYPQPSYRADEYTTAVREQRQKAEQEVRLMEQLRGKTNIVDYLDHQFFSWHDATGFGVDLLIRMEKLSSLQAEMRKGRLFTDAEVLKIGRDMCQALMICHHKNILHRDIKPGNIFFNADGDYKLGDFGISRIMDNSPSAAANTSIGTAAYAAPEQFRNQYDKRIDIYSLGLVLYELCNSNRLPFAATSYANQDAVQQRLSGAPLPPPARWQQTPQGNVIPVASRLTPVILKACAFRPEDRYSTAEEMLQALNQLADAPYGAPAPRTYAAPAAAVPPQRAAAAPTASVPTQRAKPDSGINILALIGIAAAVLVIVGLVVLLFSGHIHSWTAATCREPKFCRECGETEGVPLTHQWERATCKAPRTCMLCGETDGIPLSHQWKDATCAAPKTCELCAETIGEPLAHQWIAATRLAPKTCAVCQASVGDSLGYSISECEVLSTSNIAGSDTDVAIGNWKDNFGQSYPDSVRFWVADLEGWSNTEYITFHIAQPCTKLRLTAVAEAESDADAESIIRIYADGVLIYESKRIGHAMHPLQETVDIGNATELKILCITDSPASCYCIVDAVLYNTAS